MDREAWQATVHGVGKSWIRLSHWPATTTTATATTTTTTLWYFLKAWRKYHGDNIWGFLLLKSWFSHSTSLVIEIPGKATGRCSFRSTGDIVTKNLLNNLLLACACGKGGRQLEAPECCINPMLSPHCRNKGVLEAPCWSWKPGS